MVAGEVQVQVARVNQQPGDGRGCAEGDAQGPEEMDGD
jgi:hypothetical protein